MSTAGVPLRGHMSSLVEPELATVTVVIREDEHDDEGDDGSDGGGDGSKHEIRGERYYQVPRGLICGMSEYFEKAFSEKFKEGQESKITLHGVKRWIFECFLGWLYTHKVFWEKKPESEYDDEQPGPDPKGLDTGDPLTDDDFHHPSAWHWEDLTALYIFADAYSIRTLRNTVMEAIQIKVFQTEPRQYLHPNNNSDAIVFGSLATTSPLFRLCADITTFAEIPGSINDVDEEEGISQSMLRLLPNRATQLARCAACLECRRGLECDEADHRDIKSTRAPYEDGDACLYHEHVSEEERALCKHRWVKIVADWGIEWTWT